MAIIKISILNNIFTIVSGIRKSKEISTCGLFINILLQEPGEKAVQKKKKKKLADIIAEKVESLNIVT